MFQSGKDSRGLEESRLSDLGEEAPRPINNPRVPNPSRAVSLAATAFSVQVLAETKRESGIFPSGVPADRAWAGG